MRTDSRLKRPLPNLDLASADQLLNIDHVCEVLAISDWLARRLIKQGELIGVFIGGGMVRVRVGDIRDFIATHRVVNERNK